MTTCFGDQTMNIVHVVASPFPFFFYHVLVSLRRKFAAPDFFNVAICFITIRRNVGFTQAYT